MGISDTFDLLATLPLEQRLAFCEAAIDEPHEGVQIAALRALADPVGLNRLDWVVDRFADLLPAARNEVARAPEEFLRIARAKIVSGRDPARHGAYRLVADLGGLQAIDLLLLGVADTSARVRDGVLHALERHLHAFVAACEQDAADRDAGAFPPAHRELALRILDCVLKQFAAHGQAVFVELLAAFGEVGRPLVAAVVLAQPESELRRAFHKVLTEKTNRGVVALLFAMALDKSTAQQGLAQQVLRSRRDQGFAFAVAVHVAAARDADLVTALTTGKEIPWLAIVQPVCQSLDPQVAIALVALVGRCRIEPARQQQAIEQFLGHGDAEVRRHCVEALRALRCPEGLASVERLLADGADDVRLAAARLVVDLAPRNKVELLTPLLGASNEQLRRLAMGEISKVSFARYLQRYDHMDERARQIAARALAKIDGSMLDRLTDEVASLDATRRLKALQIVEFIDAERKLREPLLELLDDPDKKVRATAVRIVELTGSVEGMKLLIGALTDPDRRVRANAIEAFEELEDRRYVQLLTPFLRDPDNRVRANAAKALWHLGWLEARDELADMLADPDESMRISAVWAIAEADLPGARELLEAREVVELSNRVRLKIRAAVADLGVAHGGDA